MFFEFIFGLFCFSIYFLLFLFRFFVQTEIFLRSFFGLNFLYVIDITCLLFIVFNKRSKSPIANCSFASTFLHVLAACSALLNMLFCPIVRLSAIPAKISKTMIVTTNAINVIPFTYIQPQRFQRFLSSIYSPLVFLNYIFVVVIFQVANGLFFS